MKKYILLLLILLLSNCGGGTSGSGLHTYEGKIDSTEGNSLSGVNITIESTGDSTTTNDNGEFLIESEASGEEVPFLLKSPTFENRFILKDIPEDSSRITFDITVDTKSDTVQVNNVRVKARFAGLCDYYFENREIIRQANRVPIGTICSLNVEVLGDGRRLSNVPVALQYASCKPRAEWKTIKAVNTGELRHAGSVEINFEYIDSEEYCRYRIVAPVGGHPQGIYPIDTFTEQEYFSSKKLKY